ncbi:MAG: protoporphyrinogen oxidase [Saprospiraceae bacterium]
MKYKVRKTPLLGKAISKEEYLIIGAGISGLMFGFYMKKKGIPFRIIEKSDKPGGLIKTIRLEGIGYAEQAANGFIWCKEMQEIADGIGLEIQKPDAASKARFLVRNNRMRRFPLGIMESLKVANKFFGKHDGRIETIEEFGLTFFGETFTKQVLEPALAGIYGASISKLSFEAILGGLALEMNESDSLFKSVRAWRKKLKGQSNGEKKASGTHSFKGGLGKLTEKLGEYLKEHIIYNADGADYFNHQNPTIITTPAYIAANILGGRMKNLLHLVEYTPIISTTLFFKKEDLPRFKEGFGCLIPRNEGRTILGVLFNSCIFPDRVERDDLLSLTCIMRDDTGLVMGMNEAEILEKYILQDLKALFGVEEAPLDYQMFKWKKGIPVYSPSLVKLWDELETELISNYPNVRLLGNYTGQISVRGMSQGIADILS